MTADPHPSSSGISESERVRGLESLDAQLCFACRKCSAGCPVADDMDLAPHQLVRLAASAFEDEAARSSGIWLCTSCQTCTTRCPNGVDVAGLMDALRQRAASVGVRSGDGRVLAFYRAFLDEVRAHGRVHELALMARYTLRLRRPPADLRLGMKMLQKGKLSFTSPERAGKQDVRRLFQRMKGSR